jgi:4-amino-4-deoxy-L-arabinose transferase-like glycosyltransferase
MKSRQPLIAIVWTIGLTIFFLFFAAQNLDNFRPLSSDESGIMAVSDKLAKHGVFGSDLYTGFFNADQHYFITLPVSNILQAMSFTLFGTSVASARAVSLLMGVLIIWLVSYLAYRWHGLAVSMLAAGAIVLWRSDLTAAYPGLPLLAVARSARYDVCAVMFVWLAIALLDRLIIAPRRWIAVAVGVCAGLATLTQFFGIFVVPVMMSAWWWQRRRSAWRDPLTYLMLVGFAAITLPYAVAIAANFSGFSGQWMMHTGRMGFTQPEFYWNNLIHEPQRYANLISWPAPALFVDDAFDRPFSPWLFVIASIGAVLNVIYRLRRSGQGDRLLALSLVICAGLLALIEQTKAPLYAIVLLPAVYIAVALMCIDMIGWAWARRRSWIKAAAALISIGLIAIALFEGLHAYRIDQRQSTQVTPYLTIGQQIDSYLMPNARVIGAERWWWALRDHPYLSIGGLWAQWQIDQEAGGSPHFADSIARTETRYIIVNDNVVGDIRYAPDQLQQQFFDYLQLQCVVVADWDDATYGHLTIYRIQP